MPTFLKNQKTPKIILYDSLVQTVQNSVGSNLFRNLYFHIGKKKIDVLENGNLSCAVVVSWILYIFRLISDKHTTVLGTVADLKKSGWIEVKKPRPGAILVWEIKKFKNGGKHQHIGFYIGKNQAVSNSSKKHQPTLHHWTFGIKNGRPVRKIDRIFWNKKLNYGKKSG